MDPPLVSSNMPSISWDFLLIPYRMACVEGAERWRSGKTEVRFTRAEREGREPEMKVPSARREVPPFPPPLAPASHITCLTTAQLLKIPRYIPSTLPSITNFNQKP